MMHQSEAIAKLTKLKERAEKLINHYCFRSSAFKEWRYDCQIAFKHIYKGGEYLDEFKNIRFYSMIVKSSPDHRQNVFNNGMESSIVLLSSCINEINDYGYGINANKPLITEKPSVNKVKLLIDRFHKVDQQIQSRHDDRVTIQIDDEYDVQDLFHALLKIYFDDVREEEHTPSYAGSSSRVDFLLKDEKIVIEIKKTRVGLSSKQIGEQLIIDAEKYQTHPDCSHLICFVYDPEYKINNPKGIENDLSNKQYKNDFKVTVIVTPQ